MLIRFLDGKTASALPIEVVIESARRGTDKTWQDARGWVARMWRQMAAPAQAAEVLAAFPAAAQDTAEGRRTDWTATWWQGHLVYAESTCWDAGGQITGWGHEYTAPFEVVDDDGKVVYRHPAEYDRDWRWVAEVSGAAARRHARVKMAVRGGQACGDVAGKLLQYAIPASSRLPVLPWLCRPAERGGWLVMYPGRREIIVDKEVRAGYYRPVKQADKFGLWTLETAVQA